MNNQQAVRPRALTPLSERLNSRELQNRPRASMQVYQSGAVLIISLVMLLLLTLIGTTSMQSTSLEEKMVGNMRDQNIAFQRAEAVLRAGEVVADADATAITPIGFSCTGDGGYYDSRIDPTLTPPPPCPQIPNWQPPYWLNINWTDPTQVATYNVNGTNYAYYIEQLDSTSTPCPPPLQAGVAIPCLPLTTRWYRITARGVGNTDNGVVLLQSTYSISP